MHYNTEANALTSASQYRTPLLIFTPYLKPFTSFPITCMVAKSLDVKAFPNAFLKTKLMACSQQAEPLEPLAD
jgi:hypothetical protein